MQRHLTLALFPFLLGLLSGCAVQPQFIHERTGIPSTTSEKTDYPGPTFVLRDVTRKQLLDVLEERLKKEGFRRVKRTKYSVTFQMDDIDHKLIKKARVSFKFVRKEQQLWTYTRARAEIPSLNVIEGTMMDVSERKPTLRRFRKLFQYVRRKLMEKHRGSERNRAWALRPTK